MPLGHIKDKNMSDKESLYFELQLISATYLFRYWNLYDEEIKDTIRRIIIAGRCPFDALMMYQQGQNISHLDPFETNNLVNTTTEYFSSTVNDTSDVKMSKSQINRLYKSQYEDETGMDWEDFISGF